MYGIGKVWSNPIINRNKMSTQGLISIVKNGHTIIKIVCGCNGFNAEKVARIIKYKRLEKIHDIYNLALRQKFGCKDCLVVMNNDEIFYGGEADEEVFLLYRETFDDPKFNPRWRYGTADYVVVLNY